MERLIFGHQNPDTDSVTSAVSYAYLKTQLGEKAKPYVLGRPSRETQYALDTFNVKTPELLNNVKSQLKDLNYDKTGSLRESDSLYDAYKYMKDDRIRTLPIVNDSDRLVGIITMEDIAMSLINRDQTQIVTTYDNILEVLEGNSVHKVDHIIRGHVVVAAFTLEKLKKGPWIDEDAIVIVGEREDILEYVIQRKVKAIVITGELALDTENYNKVKKGNINVITTDFNTYDTAKNMFLTNFLSEVMISENLEVFYEEDYVTDRIEDIKSSPHSKFPLIDGQGQYLGMIGRKDFIAPHRKEVILVDHNEYEQSAKGIEEAEVVEVIDHHRIGTIRTTLPITYLSRPVGSTNTIVYDQFMRNGVPIPREIAGIMLSGILSDTLILKSPTTTPHDRYAVEALAEIAGVDYETYGVDMFRYGTDISGLGAQELVFSDYKEFEIEEKKVGISQVFTLDIESILQQKEDFIATLTQCGRERHQDAIVLAVTDILSQGSYFFYSEGAEDILNASFKRKVEQGSFIEAYVSRKKQIVPSLTEGIRLMISHDV